MIVYLVRHGETEWNHQNRFQGREDIPLNENGIKQAQRIADSFFKGKKLSYIATSPLMRARETAEVIAQRTGCGNLRVDDRLIERDLGAMSGLNNEERHKLREKGPIENMEPLKDVMERMYQALCEFSENPDIKNKLELPELAGNNDTTSDSAKSAKQDTVSSAIRDTMKFGGKYVTPQEEIHFDEIPLTSEEEAGPCAVIVSHGAAINALLSVLSKGEIGSGRTLLRNVCISTVKEFDDGFRICNYDFVEY
jgi:broad specificity phosphatase PhoE